CPPYGLVLDRDEHAARTMQWRGPRRRGAAGAPATLHREPAALKGARSASLHALAGTVRRHWQEMSGTGNRPWAEGGVSMGRRVRTRRRWLPRLLTACVVILLSGALPVNLALLHHIALANIFQLADHPVPALKQDPAWLAQKQAFQVRRSARAEAN